MNKKIFLLLAFFIASVFVKAQVKAYEYSSNTFNETTITGILEDARKNGTQEWEIQKLKQHLYERLAKQKRRLALGGVDGKTINNPPAPMLACQPSCSNLGFESGNTTGWTLTSGDINSVNLPCNTCASGAGAITALTTVSNSGAMWTNGIDNCSGQPALAPGGGVYSIAINNMTAGGKMQEIQQQFNVTATNNVLTYQYLAVLENPGHPANEQPYFFSQVLAGNGTAIACTYYLQAADAAAAGWVNCPAAGCSDAQYKGWVTVTLDLTSYIGQCVTLQFIASDCNQGGHYGYAYIDASCDQVQVNNTITVCPPSAQLCGPAGFLTYAWTGPVTGSAMCLPGATAGNYTLVTTAACPAPTRFYTVTVSPTPTVAFTSTVTPCNTTVPFTDGSTIGGGATIANWGWTFQGGTPATSTAQNPSVVFASPGTYNVVLTCTSSVGCVATHSTTVTIGTGPTAAFSASTVCQGSPTVFTNTSTGATTYTWTFGDGGTSNATNPTYTYPGGAGTYTAVLTAAGAGACVATKSVTVVVSPPPTASFTANPVCLGTATSFTTTTNPAAGLTYTWTFGDPANGTSAVNNPSYTYGTSNTFAVSVTVAIGTCSTVATNTVQVNPIPTASFTVPEVCQGTGSAFTSTVTGGNTFVWNFGGAGVGTNTTTATPTYTYSSSGTFPVSVIVTAAGGCSVTATGSAIIDPMPVLSITTTPACDGSAVTVTNNTPAQGTFTVWAWDFGDNIGTSAVAAPGSYTYAGPGIYTVTLIASTATGCSGTVTTTAIVHPNPVPDFTYFQVCNGDDPDFSDSSFVVNPVGINDNVTGWAWSFGDGGTSTLPSPSYTYALCGVYSVSLTATTNFNCAATAVGTETVYCIPNVTAPPSFSICPATPVTSVQTAFTTTCSVPVYGGTAAGIVFVNDNPTLPPYSYQTQTHGGIPQADTVDINSIPNYNAIAQNLSCGLLKDTVYGIAVTMDALGNIGCVGNMQTFTISVYPTPTVTPMSDINVCANQPINVPNFTGCPTPETFNWIATGDNVGIAAVSPANIGSFPSQNATDIVAVSQVSVTPVANGCTGASTTFSITVNSLPTLTATSWTACPGTNVPSPTIVTDPVAGVTLAWAVTNNVNIGMPASGTGTPAAYTAPANDSLIDQIGVVTYTPTLNTCVGTPATATITILPTPVIQPIASVSYCPNQGTTSIPFVCLPSNQGTPNYNWIITNTPYDVGLTPATGISNNIPAFTTSANNTGTAQTGVVTIGASLNNCPSTFSNFNITVYPTPTPKFSYVGPVCDGQAMAFNDLSTPSGGSIAVNQWAWDFNNDGGIDANAQDPSYTYPVGSAGSMPVTLYIGTSSVPSCTAQVTEPIFVSPNPVASFVGDSLKSCSPRVTNFTDLSSVTVNGVPTTSITTWVWTFGNGNTSNANPPPQQTYTNISSTQSAYFSVSLTVTTDSGCVNKKTINNYVQVYPRPTADFGWGPAGVDIDDPTVTFVDQSIGASGYPASPPYTYGANGIQYYLGDVFAVNQNSNTVYGGPSTTTFSHVYEYYDPYTYYVTQWVINSMGCKDSITKPVEILPNFTFYIPNAFSPNGDGTNEGFKGTGIGIDNTTYNFWIFDRWGMMIFYADDLEKAWDGHMRGSDGKPILQQDVYVWKVKFQDNINHKEHEYHGTVTLLK